MLSYRHGFHAGNHADVLKHMVLCLILRHLKAKGKPLSYIDTHSGAGAYSLQSAWSQQTSEYKNGVEKILNNRILMDDVPEYYRIIDTVNEGESSLKYYPGSPMFTAQILDDSDNAHFMELHPTEYDNLKYNLHHYAYCHVHHRDAEEGLL
ncbi:23S rRNA (adenine(2030)-N(6))-methyltransferase RlmJ, partial [Ruminobacter sp.]|uniref:23S rRNA (adenine(2030)-N(6))-methyltransferase RlmJ n=1 Tax=Ruminobacter sp. TaxID=2774296 RepID=UPI00386DCEE6